MKRMLGFFADESAARSVTSGANSIAVRNVMRGFMSFSLRIPVLSGVCREFLGCLEEGAFDVVEFLIFEVHGLHEEGQK
jgi:hypothetical protein